MNIILSRGSHLASASRPLCTILLNSSTSITISPSTLSPNIFNLQVSSLSSSSPRYFSAQAEIATPPSEGEQTQTAIPGVWKSKATRVESLAKHRNLRGSTRKLNDTCRLVRGLSVNEALIQLKMSQKRNAVYIAKCIKNATIAGMNNFHMDYDRLIVSMAHATRFRMLRKIRYHAKGKASYMRPQLSHLFVAVKEIEPVAGEKRVGRYGRKHATVKKTLELLQARGVVGVSPLKYTSVFRRKW